MFLLAITANMGLASASDLVAEYTKEAITLDGNPSEAAWAKAKAIETQTVAGIGATTVTMKALYDDQNIYIFARWLDESKTESVLMDGWEYKGGKWELWKDPVTGRAEEDRFSIQWEIGTVQGFATLGCQALCHPGQAGWKDPGLRMHTKNPGERTDEWHWKSARSNPLGMIHDKYIYDKVDPEDVEAGHGGDGPGYYGRNRNKDKTGPEYLELSPKDKADATFMLQSEIAGGKAAPLATYTGTIAEGTLAPGRTLDESKAVGDVADPKVKGVFKDGYWILEIKRALNTGSTNDVQFDPAKKYHFAIAVFDNSGHEPQHSYQVGVNTLSFAPKEAPKPAPAPPAAAPQKGVCGPTALLALAMLPLGLRALRRRI